MFQHSGKIWFVPDSQGQEFEAVPGCRVDVCDNPFKPTSNAREACNGTDRTEAVSAVDRDSEGVSAMETGNLAEGMVSQVIIKFRGFDDRGGF